MVEKSKVLLKNYSDIVFSRDMDAFNKMFEKCDITAIIPRTKNMNILSFPGLNIKQLQFLIDNRIDINGDCGNGLSAVAYQANSVEKLKLLIQNGADINLKISAYPGSALEYAEAHHFINNISNLIECGVNADKINLEEMIYYTQNTNIVSLLKITKYKLSKGEEITEKMRNMIYSLGEKFEFYRDSYDKNSVDEVSEALYELYKIYDVEPVPKRVLFDGKSDIVVTAKKWQQQHEELWKMLVPAQGFANTVQGEVIRIVGKVLYELLDNGGINWDSDFKRMVEAIPKYLKKGKSNDSSLLEEVDNIVKHFSKQTDESTLCRLNELVVNWVIANPKPIKLTKVDYTR